MFHVFILFYFHFGSKPKKLFVYFSNFIVIDLNGRCLPRVICVSFFIVFFFFPRLTLPIEFTVHMLCEKTEYESFSMERLTKHLLKGIQWKFE